MNTHRQLLAPVVLVVCMVTPTLAGAQFTYRPAGEIIARRTSSGDLEFAPTPSMSEHVFVPNMRYPIQNGPSFANSQVFGGGGLYHPTPDDGQCGTTNFSYPWRDTFCEGAHRGSGANPLCGAGSSAHAGDDIRAATCRPGVHAAVAALPGRVSLGTSSLRLTADDGTRFVYLHMEERHAAGRVGCGEIVGRVSNLMGRTRTTTHLHFEIWQAVRGVGVVPVPPYMSLVEAYQRLLAGDESCPVATPAARVDAGTLGDAAVSPVACETLTCGDCVAWPGCAYCPGDMRCHAASDAASCRGGTTTSVGACDVCHPVGFTCTDRFDCCNATTNESIRCIQGFCEDVTMCIANGDTCGPSDTTTHCCGLGLCGQDTGGSWECCLAPNNQCTSPSDCCGFEQCVGGVCQAQAIGESCMNTQECVGASYCLDDHTCGF